MSDLPEQREALPVPKGMSPSEVDELNRTAEWWLVARASHASVCCTFTGARWRDTDLWVMKGNRPQRGGWHEVHYNRHAAA